MPKVQPVYRLWCAIDLAAKTFTATWTIDRSTFVPPITVPQTPDGFTSLQQHLHALGIPPMERLIVLEATGS